MLRRFAGSLRHTLLVAMLLTPLAGCSTTDFGLSSFGSGQKVADLSNVNGLTADEALTQARGHFKNSDFGYSAQLYNRVVETSPKDPEGYIGLGASYDRLGRFDLADRVYASLYQLTGGTAQYYNNLGYSYMLRGSLSTALDNFRKARSLEPDNAVIANNIQLLSNATAASRA
jgi:Flp pilus assembly protein TadD